MCELIIKLQEETKILEGLIDADLGEQLIQLRIIEFLTEEIRHAAIMENM